MCIAKRKDWQSRSCCSRICCHPHLHYLPCLLYTSALSGLTVAESFRDMGAETDGPRDILFFIDNIFRFTQAGSEVSALLGRDVYKRQAMIRARQAKK